MSIKGHFNGSPEVANLNKTYKECESMSTYSKVTECKNFLTVLSECECCSTANVEEFWEMDTVDSNPITLRNKKFPQKSN